MLKDKGLSSVIPEGVKTHNKGKQLDQAFTNMPAEYTLSWPSFSDHASILLKIQFKKHEQDVNLRKIPFIEKQKDIREAAVSKETIEALLQRENCLENEARLVYKDRVKRNPLLSQWYVSYTQVNERRKEGLEVGPE